MRTADLTEPLSGGSQADQVILRCLDGLVTTDEGGTAAPTRRLGRSSSRPGGGGGP